MEKDKITYVVKSLLAAFLSIWTLTMLGLPLCTITSSSTTLMPTVPTLNGYFLFSLTSANVAGTLDPVILILGICSVVILSLAIACAIIGITLNTINFFLKKHSMTKAVSAFSIINCISNFLYMILSIVYVVIINKSLGTDLTITATTHTYIYFCVSIFVLVLYYISQPLINNHYKKRELQTAFIQSNNNYYGVYGVQPQQNVKSESVSTPKANPPKALKTANINIFDELIKYKELLDEKIITQEEFDKMKSRIFEAN